MKTIHIYKAQGFTETDEVESLTLSVDKELPEFESLEHAVMYYEVDATQLCNALYNALPGGTFDRLVAHMLTKKASHFRVSHGGITQAVEEG